jgi:uncharacterized protein (DUF486 family)
LLLRATAFFDYYTNTILLQYSNIFLTRTPYGFAKVFNSTNRIACFAFP